MFDITVPDKIMEPFVTLDGKLTLQGRHIMTTNPSLLSPAEITLKDDILKAIWRAAGHRPLEFARLSEIGGQKALAWLQDQGINIHAESTDTLQNVPDLGLQELADRMVNITSKALDQLEVALIGAASPNTISLVVQRLVSLSIIIKGVQTKGKKQGGTANVGATSETERRIEHLMTRFGQPEDPDPLELPAPGEEKAG